MLTKCATTTRIITDGTTARGNNADRSSANGNNADSTSANSNKTNRTTAKTNSTEGSAADGNKTTGQAANRQYAGCNVSDGDDATSVPANFAFVRIGAEGNIVKRHAP